MNDVRKLPVYKHVSAVACFVLCAFSPLQGIAQDGSMYYSTAGGGVKVITQGVGIRYSDAPSGTIRAGAVLPSGSGVPVGASRVYMSGGDAVAKTTGLLPIGAGRTAPIDVVSRFVKPSAAVALGRLASKVILPVQIGVALYDFMQEMGFTPTRKPDGDGVDLVKVVDGIQCASDCYEYTLNQYAYPYEKSALKACQKFTESNPGNVATISGTGQNVYCFWTKPYSGGGLMMSRAIPPFNTSTTYPATIEEFQDAVKSRPEFPADSNYAKAVAQAVNSGESVQLHPPTLSGPSSVPGTTTTTTNPDGTTTTKTDSSQLTYSGDTVTINTTNVTSNHNPVTNITTNTTSVTTNQPPPEEKDPCMLNPDSLMCQKPDLDTPEGEVPRENATVTYSAEDLGFGGGSCPADVMLTMHGMQTIKAWDWAGTCSKITTYAKPMILALASFAALMIIFAPGREL